MLRNNPNFNLMEKAARFAGRRMLRDFDEVRQLQTSIKGTVSFSNRAHDRAETRLVEKLAETRPNYGFRCMLLGDREGTDPTRYWIVNALDGRVNFSHGVPNWSVTVALEHKGQCVLGLVFDVLSNEMFAAERGGGSWLNESRIRTSSRTRVADMLVSMESSKTGDGLEEAGERVRRIEGQATGVRSLGSPSLGLAWLASGRFDGYVGAGMDRDEIMAASLVVTEAGGMASLSPPDGDAGYEIIAATGSAFDAFAGIVRGDG